MIVAKGAFIADSNESCRTNVGIADRTFAVAFVTKSTDGDTRLLPAHNEIAERMSAAARRWGVRETYG